ncbi:caveolin-1-like [Ptychodera flava]|uniref:caveolin-1-like n=1 Tax=Ptychodera flava TaxID=63121 RepID=UPI00396A6F2D
MAKTSDSVMELTGEVGVARPIAAGVKDFIFNSRKMYDENIYNFDDHVELSFPEVFQEPKDSRNWKPIVGAYGTLYSVVQDFTYRVLVALLGWLLGTVWGLLFGVLNFVVVWLIQPILKIFFIIVRILAIPWAVVLRASFDPVFESIGHVLSHMRGNFNIRAHGVSMDLVKTA